MTYQVGDLIIHNGRPWTIVFKQRRKHIVLQSGLLSMKLWTYELDWMIKSYPNTKYFSVTK